MGREVRRVALDFDWPLEKVWKGFLNPHFRPCPAEATGECHSGYTGAGRWLDSIGRFLALIGEQAVEEPYADRLRERGIIYPHPYLEEFAQAPRTSIPHDAMKRIQEIEDRNARFRALDGANRLHSPKLLKFGDEMVQLIKGLAGGENLHTGSGAGWAIQKTLMKAAGIDPESNWGVCKVCEGHAIDPAVRETYENWQKEPPPKGEGWQLWETVSEGSPVSPVFPTKEEFVVYLIRQGHSQKAAERFCETGWAPSAIVHYPADGGKPTIKSNVDVYDNEEE